MVLTKAIVRDPPAARRFRLIAPILVVLALALLAMLPGLLVHIGSVTNASPASGTAERLVLDHSR
jgi:hypothetical protein